MTSKSSNTSNSPALRTTGTAGCQRETSFVQLMVSMQRWDFEVIAGSVRYYLHPYHEICLDYRQLVVSESGIDTSFVFSLLF